MDFSDALRAVRNGQRVTRALWRDDGHLSAAWLELFPAQAQVMDQLMIVYPDGTRRPFAGANWDLLSDDWSVVTA